MQKIKVGDFVTVKFTPVNCKPSSNVYRVEAKLKGNKAVLVSPWSSTVCIIRPLNELNVEPVQPISETERCLKLCLKHKKFLGFISEVELESILYHFIVNNDLSPRQKETISKLCGKISRIILMHDVSRATKLIQQTIALLDPYHTILYNSLKPCLEDNSKLDSEDKLKDFFRLAGYCLAHNEYWE